MSFIQFISNHTFLVAIVVIGIFLFYQFYLRPKFSEKPQIQTVQTTVANTSHLPIDQKEGVGSRMARGFTVMADKIRNSEFIKNQQEEQKTAKFDDMLPKELMGSEENPEPVSKTQSETEKKRQPVNDGFSMDLSDMTKVDF